MFCLVKSRAGEFYNTSKLAYVEPLRRTTPLLWDSSRDCTRILIRYPEGISDDISARRDIFARLCLEIIYESCITFRACYVCTLDVLNSKAF